MKKKRMQGIAVAVAAVAAIAAVAAYSYSGDVARQKGLQFGAELEQIQADVRGLQTEFYSQTALWREGEITRGELLAFYDRHLEGFGDVISRYGGLEPPETFGGAVGLLELSSQTQMESDMHYAEWVRTGDESSKIRSDSLLQESLGYETLGLGEFYSAKSGARTYADEPFTAPPAGLAQRVSDAAKGMVARCDSQHRDESGGFASAADGEEWQACADAAQKWKLEHLP